MKTYKFQLGEEYSEGKLTKWSGGFTQLTLSFKDRKIQQKSIFFNSHNVTLKNPGLITLGTKSLITKQELKWWGTLEQKINAWAKETQGYYEQEIEIKGTGYKFEIEPTALKFDIGKSHEYSFDLPKNIEFAAKEKGMTKIVKGKSTNKQDLTQFLANIRKLFPLNIKQHGIVIKPITYTKNVR